MSTVTVMCTMYIVATENDCQKLNLTFAIIYKFMEMSLSEKYVLVKLKYLIILIFIVNN